VCTTTPTDCAQIQLSGPVSATGLGNSNLLSACMTFDNTSVTTNLDVCFAGVGNGTITSDNGKTSINLEMSGLLCIADEFPVPTPTGVIFDFSGRLCGERWQRR
jgi:hypothetical protein